MAGRPISRMLKVMELTVAALLCGGGAVWLLYLNLFGEGVLGRLGLVAAAVFAAGVVMVWIIVRRWPESELPKTWDTH